MIRDLNAIALAHQVFTLVNGRPVQCTNPLDWIEWMKTTPRPAEKTALHNKRELYTSFMGYGGERRESQPLTFATVLKPEPQLPEFAVVLEWYYDWNEAAAGHIRYAEQFKKLPNVDKSRQR